jgi:hypothetical protein
VHDLDSRLESFTWYGPRVKKRAMHREAGRQSQDKFGRPSDTIMSEPGVVYHDRQRCHPWILSYGEQDCPASASLGLFLSRITRCTGNNPRSSGGKDTKLSDSQVAVMRLSWQSSESVKPVSLPGKAWCVVLSCRIDSSNLPLAATTALRRANE